MDPPSPHNIYFLILHFLVFVFVLPHVFVIVFDFHAFPKVATLPDTKPIASKAQDIKMHQRWGGGRGGGGSIFLKYQSPPYI